MINKLFEYSYSTNIKGQLNQINIYDRNHILLDTINISYLANDPFRPSLYKGNSLTWQGRRLLSYGSNIYTYNSEGIRIGKTTLNGSYQYTLEGNKIIKEIKPNNVNVIYHYDIEGMLVGFNYNSNEYFYVRDLSGNIIKILDINGNIIVEYKYDAWGNIISIVGDNDFKYINSYLYKGYYYDFESELYYCNSRYYDPKILRWISIDEVAYLDKDSATGINLWCYCNNNPVMNVDYDGDSAILFGIIFGALTGLAFSLYEDKKDNQRVDASIGGWSYAGSILGGAIGGAGQGFISTIILGMIGTFTDELISTKGKIDAETLVIDTLSSAFSSGIGYGIGKLARYGTPYLETKMFKYIAKKIGNNRVNVNLKKIGANFNIGMKKTNIITMRLYETEKAYNLLIVETMFSYILDIIKEFF